MTDNYINQITIDCFVNKEMYNNKIKQNIKKSIDKKEKKFYRKRILNLTKDLLYNASKIKLSPDIKYSFDNYLKCCIDNFKIIDKTDIIQEEYKNLDNYESLEEICSDLDDNINITKEEADKLMMRSIKINNSTLDKFVKKKMIKKENEIVLPQQKNINLSDPILKTKGIPNNSIKKKKNISNIYEEKNTENYKKEYKNEENKNENKETK